MGDKQRISVVMATYNGAKYLDVQLDSLANQTCLPNELVVSDDASSDDTLSVLEHFKQRAPFEVILKKNSQNVGYQRNYERAMRLATGDIVLLCDQDDLWLPEKIEVEVGVLLDDPGTKIVISDMVICDEDLTPSRFTPMTNVLKIHRNADEYCPGCCMAIRRDFLELTLPIPVDLYDHDHWINAVAVRLDVRKLIPDRLQLYRRHNSTTTTFVLNNPRDMSPWGPRFHKLGSSPLEAWKLRRSSLKAVRDRLAERRTDLATMGVLDRVPSAVQRLDREMRCWDQRIVVVSTGHLRRFFMILRMYTMGGYKNFNGWRSAVKDLVRRGA